MICFHGQGSLALVHQAVAVDRLRWTCQRKRRLVYDFVPGTPFDDVPLLLLSILCHGTILPVVP